MSAAEPLWIFLHIPKCGGTTFKAHVERYLPLEDRFFEFSHWGRSYRAEHGLPEFADRSEAERARAQVLAGHRIGWGIHQLVPGKRDARYFSVLRDPAERCVSLYNYRWSRGQAHDDFAIWYRDWYNVEQRNFQTRFLAGRLYDGQLPQSDSQRLEMAKTLLAQCWFVTTTDRWNEGLDLIFADMGLPADWQHYRKAGDSLSLPESHPAQSEKLSRRFVADAQTEAMIAADSPLDAELVRWVRDNASRWPSNARFASATESP